MMEFDILMVIAEVAVAISGFSAVVANFLSIGRQNKVVS